MREGRGWDGKLARGRSVHGDSHGLNCMVDASHNFSRGCTSRLSSIQLLRKHISTDTTILRRLAAIVHAEGDTCCATKPPGAQPPTR